MTGGAGRRDEDTPHRVSLRRRGVRVVDGTDWEPTPDPTRTRAARPRGRDIAPLRGTPRPRPPVWVPVAADRVPAGAKAARRSDVTPVVVPAPPSGPPPELPPAAADSPRRPSPAARPRRRRTRSAWGLAGLLVGLLVVTGFDPVTDTTPVSVVDFTRPVRDFAAADVGVGISTYGATPLGDPVQARVERALDARSVRVPVAIRGGRVSSGAAGAGDVDVVRLVRTYRSWGYRVLVVVNGRTTDNDVGRGDTTRIVAALGYGPDVQYTTSNEPDGPIDTVLAQARMIVAEGRALYPSFAVWAPAWSSYDLPLLTAVGAALGPALAGIDFHRYAMGQTYLGTDAAMLSPPALGAEVAAVRAGLAAIGLRVPVAVDELNLTWRYENGFPGGDTRVFTAVSTAWIASACGHVLAAGGRCLPYAMQNGPLGMTVEDGQVNPDGRPVSSTMPAYWGVAAWTGASRFPHAEGRMYATRSVASTLDVFATDNEAGGRSVLLVNRSTTRSRSTRVQLKGLPIGTYVVHTTDPAHPYDAPVATARAAYGAAVTVTLAPLSVATIVLTPGAGGRT